MCNYSPMPHTLSYCALIGKCALIRLNTVMIVLRGMGTLSGEATLTYIVHFISNLIELKS